MFASTKIIVWLLCISCAEVGLIMFSAKKLGAAVTFCLFIAFTAAGLLVQLARWYRLKPIRDERDKYLEKAKRLREKGARLAADYWRSPEGTVFMQLSFEIMQYWLATILLILPGFLFHVLGFLSIVPATRPTAWFILTCGSGYYPYIADSAGAKRRLPRTQRRL